jgi:DNA recombination protein RmuC
MAMDAGIIMIFILVVVIILGIFYYLLTKSFREQQEKTKPTEEILEFIRQVKEDQRESKRSIDDMSKFISESMSKQSRSFVSVLQKNTADLNQRLDKAAQVIGGVQKNIGEMSEVGRAMKDLQEYLRSPKLRGNIGEQVLAEVLQQLLPKDLYTLQYSFKNGEKVDAVIKVGDSLIPVDAKFPMENFRRMNQEEKDLEKKQFRKDFKKDVKKHLNDIAKKYILTEEGTVDYAIMYIPSESIYYEVINSQELFDASRERRILVVSPMSFYAYLKAILMSFQGQTIQKKAKEILIILQATSKDYEKVEESLSILEKHLTNAYNQLQNVSKFFLRLGQKLTSTKMLESGEEK